MNKKIFDCVTFFQETLHLKLRLNILKDVIDQFIICESIYDHRGNKKDIIFDKKKFPEFEKKINHLIIKEPFPQKNIPWENQALQRDYIFTGLEEANDNDLILFSDPDEIPNPDKLYKLELEKKYAIFLQSMYTYKINIFNHYESPWEGTRASKKKDLKSIDWLRQKVLLKNLKYSFWRFDKEKSIQVIHNGGWHFNYLLTPKNISKKLKSLAATEWNYGEGISKEEFYSLKNIEDKILNKKDLFNRGHVYKKIDLDKKFPKFILDNRDLFNEWII